MSEIERFLFGGDALGEDAFNDFTEYFDDTLESFEMFRWTVSSLLKYSEQRFEMPDNQTLTRWMSALIIAKQDLGAGIYTANNLACYIESDSYEN